MFSICRIPNAFPLTFVRLSFLFILFFGFMCKFVTVFGLISAVVHVSCLLPTHHNGFFGCFSVSSSHCDWCQKLRLEKLALLALALCFFLISVLLNTDRQLICRIFYRFYCVKSPMEWKREKNEQQSEKNFFTSSFSLLSAK